MTIDATVVLVPAEVTVDGRHPGHAAPTRSRAITGRGLAEAVRSIEEGARLLADARASEH